jgi:hypothetical protein
MASDRKLGFYWIKENEGWATWKWTPKGWTNDFTTAYFDDDDIGEIGPYIPNPDEINSSPVPAAAYNGLETAAWQRKHPTEGWMDCREEDTSHYRKQGQDIRELSPRSQAEDLLASANDRLNQAYSQRAYAAACMARMALSLGYKAGIGRDAIESNDPEWRVILYIDTPNGQVSWHIAPQDQWILDGLPQYDAPWDGTFRSRDGSFAKYENISSPIEEKLRTANQKADQYYGEAVVSYDRKLQLKAAKSKILAANKALLAADTAITIADKLIERSYGSETPKKWHQAVKSAQKSRRNMDAKS